MTVPLIFDRALVRKRRLRAMPHWSNADFLKREACSLLAERLADIRRDFPRMVELGAHHGILREYLQRPFVQTEQSFPLAQFLTPPAVICDEELLPFGENTLDAVVSALSLHTVNDLPGTFAQICRALKPDGLFIAILPGAASLRELRESLAAAEMELEGGISPHVAPFLDVRDAGNLLQRAGFALPMADSTPLTLSYAHPYALLQDLRHMGETNPLKERQKKPVRRATLARAFAYYQERFPDSEGRVTATFDLITLTGWKPAPSQPRALAPGTGRTNLKDFLNS